VYDIFISAKTLCCVAPMKKLKIPINKGFQSKILRKHCENISLE